MYMYLNYLSLWWCAIYSNTFGVASVCESHSLILNYNLPIFQHDYLELKIHQGYISPLPFRPVMSALVFYESLYFFVPSEFDFSYLD